jgi:transposase
MIINGLGMISSPLYLFGKFFEGKATEHLLGAGILPEHLNDDCLGRALDKLLPPKNKRQDDLFWQLMSWMRNN